MENYPGKISESNILYITVSNHDNPIDVLLDNQIQIPIIYDYTNFTPYYTGDEWWYYDEKTKIVHVMIANDLRTRYQAIVQKREAGQFLSIAEEKELKDCEHIINAMPRLAAEKAVFLFDTTEKKEKKKYRTRKNAGEVDVIPAQIPAITNQTYKNAMTLNQDNKAYLQPISSTDNLVYVNGQLLFKGFPATIATLKRYYTLDGIENFDLPLLRVFYGIILNRFAKTWQEDQSVEDVVTIYYPDLAKMLGKSPNINQKNIDSCINSIVSFQSIMGIINRGSKGSDILPVLVYMGNDVEKNTISFASPYMVRVIRNIYKASIRKSKTGLPVLQKNGEPKLFPSYSYLIKSSIVKEKNKKAIEIVFIVVSLIEQCGNNVPHIKASTIIERNQLLKESIQNCKATADRNKILKRAFSKAWEILVVQTVIQEKYKNISLPKTTDTPTMSNLDMVFKFPHEGKIR